MTRLRSCKACSRHVFVTETQCPFCQAELAPVSNAPIFDIKAGMSRAQRFTLVAAVASQALIGCSDDPKGGVGTGSGGSTQQGSGGMPQGSGGAVSGSGGSSSGLAGKGGAQPVYGAPIDPQGSGGSASSGMGSGGQGIGGAQAVYGAPPPIDAGMQDAGDGGDDQANKDAGRIQPVYGAPVYGGPIPLYGAIPPDEDNK